MSLYTSVYNNSPLFLQNCMVSAYGYAWRKRRFGGIFNNELVKAKDREFFSLQQWNKYQEIQLQLLLVNYPLPKFLKSLF